MIRIAVATLALLFVVVASGTRVATQELSRRPRHTRCTVIDLGTFGGPHSQFNFGSRVLNQKGTAVVVRKIPSRGFQRLCNIVALGSLGYGGLSLLFLNLVHFKGIRAG